jgi:hypothetical protein
MKNSIKFAAATLCLTLGMTYSQAQTNTSVTINPQVLTISLTGFAGSGGNASSVKVGNKEVLNAMGFSGSGLKLQTGTATVSLSITNDGTNVVITSTKQLFVVTSGNSKSNNVVDVTKFFSVATNSPVLTKGKTSYAITDLGFGVDSTGVVLTNADGSAVSPMTFLVQGFTTVQGSGAFNSAVNGSGAAGSGTNSAASAVLKGTVNAGAPNKKTLTFVPAF